MALISSLNSLNCLFVSFVGLMVGMCLCFVCNKHISIFMDILSL